MRPKGTLRLPKRERATCEPRYTLPRQRSQRNGLRGADGPLQPAGVKDVVARRAVSSQKRPSLLKRSGRWSEVVLGGTLEPRFAPRRAVLGPVGGLDDPAQGVFQQLLMPLWATTEA